MATFEKPESETVKFGRQHPIGSYIADFVCLEQRIVIEVDGSQHAQQTEYDSVRTAYFQTKGFRMLRFWDNDVLARAGSVLQAIYNVLDVDPSP